MNKERAKAYARELYYWRKEHGICTVCGKRDALKGRVRCAVCTEKEDARSRKRYYTFTPEEKQEYIRHSCANAKKLREKRKSEGLCPMCGKPALKGRVRCMECTLKERRRRKEREARKEAAENETSL